MAITAIKMVQEMNDQPLVIEPLSVRDVVRTLESEVVLTFRLAQFIHVSSKILMSQLQ